MSPIGHVDLLVMQITSKIVLEMFWFQEVPSLKINFRKLEIIPRSEVDQIENIKHVHNY